MVVRLTFINGIRTDEKSCSRAAHNIGELFGAKCYPFWNPTAGALLDFSQAARQKLFSSETPEVRGLANHLREHIAAVGKNGIVVHIAHSQGSLITFLCSRHLTIAERAKIKVISIGGAQSLTDNDFASTVNYYTTNEPMLFFDSRASKALKLLQAHGRPIAQQSNSSDSRHVESSLRWRSDRPGVEIIFDSCRFVFIHPLEGGFLGINDHSINSTSYNVALRHEGETFRAQHLSWWQRLFPSSDAVPAAAPAAPSGSPKEKAPDTAVVGTPARPTESVAERASMFFFQKQPKTDGSSAGGAGAGPAGAATSTATLVDSSSATDLSGRDGSSSHAPAMAVSSQGPSSRWAGRVAASIASAVTVARDGVHLWASDTTPVPPHESAGPVSDGTKSAPTPVVTEKSPSTSSREAAAVTVAVAGPASPTSALPAVARPTNGADAGGAAARAGVGAGPAQRSRL